MSKTNSRRHFIGSMSSLALSCAISAYADQARAEAKPEVKRIRLLHVPAVCYAPQYLAEELLHLEGFSEVEYVPFGTRNTADALAESHVDMTMWNSLELLPHLDQDKPVVVLAGMHGGCFVLFGHEHVRSVRDLRGRSVSIMYPGGGDQILLSSMLSYVGMNPKEVQWKPGTASLLDAMEMFADRQSDAFIGFAQQPVELRARKVGHVIIDTSIDRPWSQYYCCMLAANRDFVQRNPIATKRAVRAMLKAADFCAAEPLKVARYLSDRLYEPRFQIGLEVMNNVAFDRWRNSDPTNTLLFHALRLHEVGILKNHPNRIIAQGTDWRFLEQVRRELKA